MRKRPTAAPTWESVIARVEGAERAALDAPPRPDSPAITVAQTFDRNLHEPADILAELEREVAEPETRAALDAMVHTREEQRRELAELDDDLEVPDERTWMEKRVDSFWLGLWGVVLGLALIPLPEGFTLDLPVGIAAVAAIIAVSGAVAVQSGRTKREPEWRGMLLAMAALVLLAPIITGVRIAISRGSLEAGPVTLIGVAVQLVVIAVMVLLASRAPTAAEHEERRRNKPEAERTAADRFYDDVEDRMTALEQTLEEDGPALLREALGGRDPAVARATRPTVIAAVRVLFEREQIDADEAEWMVREALGGQE